MAGTHQNVEMIKRSDVKFKLTNNMMKIKSLKINDIV